MVFRLILLLAIVGALTVFTLQNLTPLLPLVFLGIQFPALPLSWWVLGAGAAGAISMLAIQILIGLSNFVTGQTVRSRVRARVNREAGSRGATTPDQDVGQAWKRQSRREQSTVDDSTWQDWRGYESPSTQQTAPRPTPQPLDDWERSLSDDWEGPAQSSTRRSMQERGSQERVTPRREPIPPNSEPADRDVPPRRSVPPDSTYSYSAQEPQDTGVNKTEPVVDADFRVIVPPYRPLDESIPYTPPPPPPPVAEENADDWFEESSDDFGEPNPSPKPS
jgi:hypothetical protein